MSIYLDTAFFYTFFERICMKEYILGWWYLVQAQLSHYPVWLMQVTLFGLSGLIAGFIAKNFGKMLIYTVIGVILLLWLLSYLNYISINSVAFKDLFGVTSAHSIDDIIRIYGKWAHEHMVGCIAGAISFLLGWRLG